MEKKKFSIELPKGGMSDLTKKVRSQKPTDLPADASEWQRFIQMCLAVQGRETRN